MKQLHSATTMILLVAVLLVINAVCIFGYRDAVLSCETRKDSMLNFSIKYETLASSLRSEGHLYHSTANASHLDYFDQWLNEYYRNDTIDLGYAMVTAVQSTKELRKLEGDGLLQLDSQLTFLHLNSDEEANYLQFKEQFEQLLSYLKDARKNKDFSTLQSTEFQILYNNQSAAMAQLNEAYINRINKQEDHIIQNQGVMEFTLISLTILLLCLATFAFRLLTEENAYNSYFRKLYTTIVENINVGLSIVNESGQYEYMNPQYQRLLNIESEDPLGKTPGELFPSYVSQLLNVCGNNPTEGHLNLEIQETQRYMDYNHFIIFDENNQKKYIDLIHDRTETEHMQQQLRNQLHEIELYSHAKDAFLANISHEIKTPINAIVGMTHFLGQSELTFEQQDIISKINASSDVLLSIINDVLDFSKIKANSLCLHPSAFPLNSVLQNVEDMFAPQITEKGLHFERYYDIPNELFLYMDRTRLTQIFVNLLGNAYKFTESGRIALSAVSKDETEDAIHLEFCVEDTGIGIEKKDVSRLFQEFEQIENHLTKRHEGTGLGLSICKHIVETMGGSMWVTSLVGQGSKFYFSIPCPKATEEQRRSCVNSQQSSARFDGHGAHVLVVEDTDINLEIVARLLADVNIICHTAKDGVEAVDQCKQHPSNFFRVILMDIHMPRMDGYTASHIIKKQLQVTSPILALTATSMEEAAQQEDDVMAGYILKPFKIEQFYATLQPFFPCGEDPYAGSKEAIHNLGGLEKIYYKHVVRFKENYAESADEIREFIELNDYDEAKRKAHTVKGLAGTLGMLHLHQAATELVTAISTRASDLNSLINTYEEALKQVLEAAPAGMI